MPEPSTSERQYFSGSCVGEALSLSGRPSPLDLHAKGRRARLVVALRYEPGRPLQTLPLVTRERDSRRMDASEQLREVTHPSALERAHGSLDVFAQGVVSPASR
jgi:hypothetical protein